MKMDHTIKKGTGLLVVLITLFCLSSLCFSEEVKEIDLIDIPKQLTILDAIEKAEEKAIELKNGGFKDEYTENLLSEIKSVLKSSDYLELSLELKRINRTISAELMSYIKNGLSLKKKPTNDDYSNAIELRNNILDRVEFIYNLENGIKRLMWDTKKILFWNGLSVKVDLSPLNRSQELFDMGEYDNSWKVFNTLNKKIESKSYQDVDRKKESLLAVLDCEEILDNIEKEGFDDEVAKNLLEQTKTFFKSKKFSSLINRIDDINDPSWRDARELLIASNSSSRRPINEDYDRLIEFKQKITERKERLGYIEALLDHLGMWLEDDEDIPELSINEYAKRFDNALKLFSDNSYDKSFEEALSIEIEIEDKIISLMIDANEIIMRLNTSNFSVVYLSDLLYSVYDKFSSFHSEELLKKYKESNEDDKIIFVETELVSTKKSEEGYSFIDFDSVVDIINEIKYREEQIYRIDESINLLSGKIEDYSAKGIDTNVPEKQFEDIVYKFNNENYDDAESGLFEANTKLELARARLTVLNVLSVEGLSFLQRNKYKIIIFSFLIFAILFYGWIKLRVKILIKKLDDLKLEKNTLENLIKKAQVDHFAKAEMSTTIYNIKYEEFTEKLNSVKAAIPVQETVLARQLKFNRRFEGWFLKFIDRSRKVLEKAGILKKTKRKKKKEEKIEGILLNKTIKDVLVTAVLTIILIVFLYLLNIFQDSFLRYSILMLCFSFFIVLIALLIKRIMVIPIVFIVISMATMNIDIFDIKGIKLIFIFTAAGVLSLLLFHFLNLLIKRYSSSVIITVILVFALIPIMSSLLIFFSLTKTSLYDILNSSLINTLLAIIGSIIALFVWHRFRIMRFMLRMGY